MKLSDIKYDIGDTLWYIYGNRPRSFVVNEIRIYRGHIYYNGVDQDVVDITADVIKRKAILKEKELLEAKIKELEALDT